MREFDYISYIIKDLADSLTPREQNDLNNWLDQSKANQLIRDEFVQTWDVSKEYKSSIQVDTNQAYNSFVAKLQTSTGQEVKNTNPYNFGKLKWIVLGAVLLTLLGLAVYLISNFNQDKISNQTQDITNTNNDLFDAYLSPYSSIVIEDQELSIDGEVYFNKIKTPLSILINDWNLHMEEGDIFDVKSTDDYQIVTIEKGILSLTNGSQKILLSPQDEIFISNDGIISKTKLEDSTNALLWHKNELSFNNTPLKEVFEDIKQFYGVTINIEGNIPESCHYTSPLIKDMNPESLLLLIQTSISYQLKVKNSNTFTVSSIKCN